MIQVYKIHFTPSSGAHQHFLRCPVIPVTAWNWNPGVKLTGIGPAAWLMGLNLATLKRGTESLGAAGIPWDTNGIPG